MSSISEETVNKIAHLARLSINEQELPEYVTNLSNILNLVADMAQVETKHIQPMAHPLAMSQRLRDDKVTESNQRAAMQKLTPFTEAGLYLVPQVIE
ncbi:MAG: Asp-tRNA(Asn)/Glu-tRNA(Gln) amidotransferase subunit GatC [Gammaproteobacteria bacterium]